MKQVLLLFKNGDLFNCKIAETVELDKNAVNKYINQAKKDNMSRSELLLLDDPEQACRMVGGNAAYTDNRFEELKLKIPYYVEELKRHHVTMRLLWDEYVRESSSHYQLTQFKEHLSRCISGTTKKTASTVLKDLYVGRIKPMWTFCLKNNRSYTQKLSLMTNF